MTMPNAQYNLADPGGVAVRVAGRMRRRMFARFIVDLMPAEHHEILDVGVTSDRTYEHSNYLELLYPYKNRITALGVDDASFLETIYPGVRFVRGDGLLLPFADRSFDFVHSSAVIEHVGSLRQQTQLLAEFARVARKGIFVTTPNRWFPIEFHTMLPLVHWLPPEYFRSVLRRLRLSFFAEEKNLNLMGAPDLLLAARNAGLVSAKVDSMKLLGWPSNLILIHKIR